MKDRLAAEVGRRIRQVRKEKLKMAQAQVAKELGISHGTISHWERGGNAKPANLREFARLGDVSMEWLMNGSDAMAAAFHPRWAELEQRLIIRSLYEQEELFDLFEYHLDMRDRWIEQQRRRKGGAPINRHRKK